MREEAGVLYPEGVEYADTRKGLNELFDSKLMVKTTTKKVHNDYEDNATAGLGVRTSDKAGYRNHNLTMLVFGNTLINAGDVVTFTSQVQRPNNFSDNEGLNPYTSGRYVVMAMKHIINIQAQRHEMILKCFKDSVRNAYPTEEEALSSVGRANITDYNLYNEQFKEFVGELS